MRKPHGAAFSLLCLLLVLLTEPGLAGQTYNQWESTIMRRCLPQHQRPSREDFAKCPSELISTALSEGRITQKQIDECYARLRGNRFRGSEEQAMWSGGCNLKQVVANSFASPMTANAPSPIRSTQQSSPPVGDYSGIDPARARSKSTRIEGTPFRTAKPGEPFSEWATYAYSACANLPADRQGGGDRDYCPKTVVATALQLGLISDVAITDCRSAPQRPQQSEALSLYNCLERRSFNEMSKSSSTVVSGPTSEKTSTLNTKGLMKPTLVAAIHAADWAGVPPSDHLDWVYFLTTFQQISERCPNIVSKTSVLELEISIANKNIESVKRATSGQGSSQDIALAAWAAAKVLSHEDCNQHIDYEYESCQARNEEREKPLESPEAERDVKVLLDRYGCGQEINTYASNFKKSQSLKYQQLGARHYIDNLSNAGDVAKYRRIFENCAHQAGDGAAYAWCGCYVKGLSLVRGGYANPPEAVAAASRSAFFKGIGYLPSDSHECLSSGEVMINSWRSAHTPFTTACLLSSTSATGSTTPGLMACEYKTAWGQILVRDKNCESSISSKTWGDIPINCR